MAGDTSPLQEQVLVAAFPNQPPEVHVGSLHVAQRSLVLSEASVLASGEVSMSKRRTLSLAEASSVDLSDGMLAVLGPSGTLLVQLHVEDEDDRKLWAEGLRAAIRGDSSAVAAPAPAAAAALASIASEGAAPADEDTDDEVRMLQARSRQLQQRIATLEAAGERRDRTMHKMIRRLDGAMQMLSAVQEMCTQQRRVVGAQKVAISELSLECGVAVDETTSGSGDCTTAPATVAKANAPPARPTPPASAPPASAPEEEVAGQAAQMMALLQQADDLQRTLRALEAMGAGEGAEDADEGSQATPPPPPPSAAAAALASAQGDAQTAARAASANAAQQQKAEAELVGLLAEKEKFEGMLANSQDEHEELLKRLNDMRSLMGALGMDPDDDGDED